MKINNDLYGGFMVSKNIINGRPIRYSYREKSSIPQLNGWNLLSDVDDDEYISNPQNFVIINAQSVNDLAPQLLEIFDAPYGTDLFWIYEEGVHVGFYDLKTDKQVEIEEILSPDS
ncbi:MAG: DUF2185 domain-containing protein [Lachnospiraceae bacterium]|nr:DUF2185 domain-containing protein [Lachnospiraceae bacterium]